MGEQITTELLSADDVNRTIARIAHQIIEKTALDSEGVDDVILLGIHSRGVPLASRLAAAIEQFSGVRPATGGLDITLYRDDLRQRPHMVAGTTTLPTSGIDKTTVILVDDVLYSGRTIRAALDALRDEGRPNRIQLAVLVDRGHRELPIRADYVGKNIPTSRAEDITVQLAEYDDCDAVVLTRTADSHSTGEDE